MGVLVLQSGVGFLALSASATSSSSAPQILPALLSAAQAKATANTTQWQTFKASLDAGLNTPIAGGYQGLGLSSAIDYALGYRMLLATNQATAYNYADKAIAGLKNAMQDQQWDNGANNVYTFLAVGDGVTATFTIPDADYNAGSLIVACAQVNWAACTAGALGDLYSAPANSWYIGRGRVPLRVNSASGGTGTEYIQGVSWQRNPSQDPRFIDFNVGGPRPSNGSTYYVQCIDYLSGNPVQQLANHYCTVAGTTITFLSGHIPTTAYCVIISYVRNSIRSGDYSTLNYQQTGMGTGGYCNGLVDWGYSIRSVARTVVHVYDWLYDYPGLTSSLKAQAEALITAWYTFARTLHGYPLNINGAYCADGLPDNYACGYGIFCMMAAAALNGRNSAAAAIIAGMTTPTTGYRDALLRPSLTGATMSEKGGAWPEGWNYGPLASGSLAAFGLVYQQAGFGTADFEAAWIATVGTNLFHARYASYAYTAAGYGVTVQGNIYSIGKMGYAPCPFPTAEVMYWIAGTSSDTTVAAMANSEIQTTCNPQLNNWEDLCLRNPSATATNPTTVLGLDYHAPGVDLVYSRADWTYASTWVAFQCGNYFPCDHQGFCAGNLLIHRGQDHLLVDAIDWSGPYGADDTTQSPYRNDLQVSDNNDGTGTGGYYFRQGVWYGPIDGVGIAGCQINAYEGNAGAGYCYATGNYEAAYSSNNHPGLGGPAASIVRSVLHLRPDYVVVYDRATSKTPVASGTHYPKQVTWHTLGVPAVTGNNWTASKGASTLFAQIYTDSTFTTASGLVSTSPPPGVGTLGYGPGGIYVSFIRTTCSNADTAKILTVFQSAPSSTVTMDASARVTSADGQLDGVLIGGFLGLFGTAPPVSFTSAVSYTFTVTSGLTVRHVVANVPASRSCTLSGAATGTVSASANGVLTFTTTGTGAAQTVTIT